MLHALQTGKASLAELARSFGDIMTLGQESLEESVSMKQQPEEKIPQLNQVPLTETTSEKSEHSSKSLNKNEQRKQLNKQKKVNAEVQKQFKAWKRTLIEIIRSQSRIVHNQDGIVTFLLPPKLVKLVWNTTIKERAAYAAQQGSDNPIRDGLTRLRDEVDHAVSLIEQNKESREDAKS